MAEKDWLTDDTMSAEETMRRFAQLKPEPTVGPSAATAPLPPVRSWGGAFVFKRLTGSWTSAVTIQTGPNVSIRS
jgi:hypothetical protein